MRRRSIVSGSMVALTLCGIGSPAPGQMAPEAARPTSSRIEELRSQGLDLVFNLDYPEAMNTFHDAIALDPTDPALHRFAAAVIWMSILFEWGAILVDDYLGEARDVVARPPPAPDADRDFREHVSTAIGLATRATQNRPSDPDAYYQLGAAEGFFASYIQTVEGRLLGSVGHARRAFHAFERVEQLDPSRHDAGLVPGMYRYSMSAMSFPTRLLARMAGIPSGREDGLRRIEAAAAYPSDAQTDAMFILIVAYNREQRYDDALRVVHELQRRYPRNRLLWLEAGTTALRAGDLLTAKSEIERGLALTAEDPRPRAYGEEARWRLSYGSALLSSDRAAAANQFSLALRTDRPAWVSGRVHKEMGKLADLREQRAKALDEYRLAAQLCRTNNDRVCAEEADRWSRTPYR